MRAKRVLGAGIGVGAVLLGAGAAVLGWGIARKLTAPVGPRTFNLVVRGIEAAGDQTWVVLDRTSETEAVGIYNLWSERCGWAQLGSDVEDRGPHQIARTITGTSAGLDPQAGDRASWSGIYFATPADAGLDAQEITINAPSGCAPAWRINGDPSTWAIHIHGLGSPRAGTLRGVQVATELGLTSLVVSYRNDGEGPRVGSGRSTLGAAEAVDVEAAISYAVRVGAERIVLFGWSMGATIALQLAHESAYAQLVRGLVLDSPVLDWHEVIKANCRRAGLAPSVGTLAIPWLAIRLPSRMLGLPTELPLSEVKWIDCSNKLSAPALILHGTQDNSVPFKNSERLRDMYPDLAALESFEAGHTFAWNSDPTRWRSAVSSWLATHLAS